MGAYELLDLIATGGQGAVYRARHRDLRRIVALKILDPAGYDQGAKLRFAREIDIHLRLSHPHLVRIYDGGVDDGLHYMAMELIDGGPLATLTRDEPASLREFLKVSRPMASALQYIHGRGIVHRDLKPGNVLISKEQVVKISDFGLARSANATLITRDGEAVGTPAYMPPEVLTRADWTPQGDMFALGVIFYELLTRSPPFSRELSFVDYVQQVVGGSPRPVGEIRGDCHPELDRMVLALLSPDPERRPNVDDVAAVLRLVDEGRVTGSARRHRRDGKASLAGIAVRSRSFAIWGLVIPLVACCVALLSLVPSRGGGPGSPPPSTATTSSVPIDSRDAHSGENGTGERSPSWRTRRDALERLDEAVDRVKVRDLKDLIEGRPSHRRELHAVTTEVLWQVLSTLRAMRDDGVSGPTWGALTSLARSYFRKLFGQLRDVEANKSQIRRLLRDELDLEASDPYRRVNDLVLATFLDGDDVPTRLRVYERCVEILEGQARIPGDDLQDHRQLIEYIDLASEASGADGNMHMDLPDFIAPTTKTVAGLHRVMDIALRCLPRVREWEKKEGEVRAADFCGYVVAECSEILRLYKGEVALELKALRVLDGYLALPPECLGASEEYESRIDSHVLDSAEKRTGYRLGAGNRIRAKVPAGADSVEQEP